MRVRVRIEFWQNAHVRAMCVRLKIECTNVRACEAKNRRNSQFEVYSLGHVAQWHLKKIQILNRTHIIQPKVITLLQV